MPAYPVEPPNFAGRKQVLQSMVEAFKYTSHAKSLNIAVVGEWGIGKTALLLKAQEIASKEFGAISFIIDVQSGQTSDAVLHAIVQKFLHQILREYPKLGLPAGGIREMKSPRLDRIAEQNEGNAGYTPIRFESTLQSLWEAIADKDRIVIIMIDNLEFLDKQELFKVVETIRNVFQALPRSGCKIMAILSGKKIFYDTSAKLYSPTARFFRRITLEEFTEQESAEAMTLPIREISDFSISKEAQAEIHRLSEGHPYILKAVCFSAFRELNGKGKLTPKKLSAIMPVIVDILGNDIFGPMLDRASEEEKKILFAFAKSKEDTLSFSEIQSRAKMSKRGTHLTRLVEKEIVLRTSRGKYRLFHPLFKAFVQKKMG